MVVLGLSGFLLAFSRRSQPLYNAARPGQAAAVGDSLTAHGGYVAELNRIPGYTWDNHGVVGQTTGRILRRSANWAGAPYGEVVILAGNNDFVGMTAAQTIGNLEQMVRRSKDARQRVVLVTTTPWGAYSRWSQAAQVRQNLVNTWIRKSSGADVVVDAFTALADPARPVRLRAEFAAPDGLHLNTKGQQALGRLIRREAY